MADEPHLRERLAAAGKRLTALGLTRGSSGNLSIRLDAERFLVTPSGRPCEALGADDIIAMTMEGDIVGRGQPSSEWRMHRDIYAARGEAQAIVHAHPGHATALACLRRGIPAFHYMVAVAGGADIRCADYATFGTQALSDRVLAALDGRQACLMANHGIICFGAGLDEALSLAVEVEALAAQYCRALQVGEPVLLSEADMAEVLRRFEDYRRGAAPLAEDAPDPDVSGS